jgi:hypothetical protein
MPDEPGATPENSDRFGPDVLHDMRSISEDSAQKLLHALEGSHPVRAIRGSQVASAVVGTVGFALFLHGIENAADDIPIIENGWGAMIIGVILLAAAGVLIRRIME